MSDPQRTYHLFNPPFPTIFNFAFTNNVIMCYFFRFSQPQGEGATHTFYPQSHTVFSFAIPILLNFLVLKYQNQDTSPFHTRPRTVLLGILSLLLYCLAYDFHCQQRIRLPSRSTPPFSSLLIHRCILFFGYMTMAILASLLFPDSATPAFYVLYVTLSVGDLLFWVCQKIRRQLRATTRFRGRGPPSLMTLGRILLLSLRNSTDHHEYLLPM